MNVQHFREERMADFTNIGSNTSAGIDGNIGDSVQIGQGVTIGDFVNIEADAVIAYCATMPDGETITP